MIWPAMEPGTPTFASAGRPTGSRPTLGLASMAALLVAILLLAVTAWLWLGAGNPAEPQPSRAELPIAALPARATDAPVLAAFPTTGSADARARNAAVPFLSGVLPAAAAFRPPASATDRARAADCLALAALAEAGSGDEAGQRAVVQVILNRVRHPAFARTVCGVVFEGSQRATGCQFSFTCDGSLGRKYGAASWQAARQRAREALGGRVYAPVGLATHYHTDWVHPWWSPKLVKLAQVETHLFFRWPGYWGSVQAARMAYRGGEPDLSGGVTAAPSPALAMSPAAAEATRLLAKGTTAQVAMRDPSGRANFLLLDPGAGTAGALDQARQLCGPAATCRVMGWTDPGAIPAALPLPVNARARLQFSYSRDPAGSEIVLYGCDTYKNLAREKCIPRPLR